MCDLGMAPGGILEGSLSSGFCSFLEACCSVIGTTLAHHGELDLTGCQQPLVTGGLGCLGSVGF